MKKFMSNVFGLALLAISTQAGAVVLSLAPSSQTAVPTDTVSLDITVSGLTAGGPDSLGDFDVDIAYDSTALSFTGYSLGAFLGDIGLGEALDLSFGDLGGGIINLAEVSLLEADAASCVFCAGLYLDDIQPDSFVLATLDFVVDVLSVGSSTTVAIDTVWALGDGFGLPLDVTGTSNAVIRNPAPSGNVPEPATVALLMLGLIGLVLMRQRQLRV